MKSCNYVILAIFIGFTLTTFSACEDDMPEYYHEKEFTLENFAAIDLGSALELEIVQAEEFKVIAKGEEEDLDDLILQVENEVLKGSYRPGSRSHKRTFLQIEMPLLKEAKLHGATESTIRGFSGEEERLSIELSGASKLSLDAGLSLLNIKTEGASQARVSGEAEKVIASVSGASKMNTRNLKASVFEVEVNGASEAVIIVDDELSGAVNGKSELKYTGNPSIVNVTVAQDSKIRKE